MLVFCEMWDDFTFWSMELCFIYKLFFSCKHKIIFMLDLFLKLPKLQYFLTNLNKINHNHVFDQTTFLVPLVWIGKHNYKVLKYVCVCMCLSVCL